MKRIISIMILALCATQMTAQNNLDTIHASDWRHYHFNYKWWEDPDSVQNNWALNFILPDAWGWGGGGSVDGIQTVGRTEVLQLVEVDDTLKVIGIAACAGLQRWNEFFVAGDYRTDDDEYLRIYKPVGNSLALIDEGLFNIHRDTAYRLAPHQNKDITFPVYEVYFDTTRLITDSFFIGMTMHNQFQAPENDYKYPTQPITPCVIQSSYYSEGGPYVTEVPGKEYQLGITNGWVDDILPYYLAVWPILEDTWPIEKRCATPDNLNAMTVGGGSSITWDGPGNQTQWQVSYGTLPNQPDSGTIVDLNSNYWYHSFNDSTMNYVYIRGYCHNERCWSLWSAPLEIGNPAGNDDTNSTEGIRLASTLDRQTRLFPNPASDVVNIISGFSIEHVDVCTLQGQMLLSQSAHGHSATIDVSALPPATYLMIVHTAAGRTAKRLVIQ